MATQIDPFPSAVSYKGIGTALEAAGGNGKDLGHLEEAVKAYRKAIERSQKASIIFYLAVALERLGNVEEAEPILESMQRSEAPASCLVDSWGYVRWHTRKTPRHLLNLHRGTRDMLQLALDAAMPLIEGQRHSKAHGLVCEFGVGSGRSLRMTQEILPLDIEIHGFDTFTGLPQAWGSEPAGSYSTGGIVPNMEGEVYFHKGLFSDTIKPFLEELGDDAYLAYANIDCDLYTSTLDILEAFHGRIVEGTIIVFDEYICHPTWRQDEFRAWRECCKRFGWKYEYLGFSLPTKQAVVRVTAA
jgi:tetratricopeptide (TPR) repeat protein